MHAPVIGFYEWQEVYATEEACAAQIAKLRWPEGYRLLPCRELPMEAVFESPGEEQHNSPKDVRECQFRYLPSRPRYPPAPSGADVKQQGFLLRSHRHNSREGHPRT